MLEQARKRTLDLQQRLTDARIDVALLTDEDSIAYYGGFWGYLGVEFGRPTVMLVPKNGAPVVVTPLMESEMVSAMTWVEDIRPWQDDGPNGWQNVLSGALAGHKAAVGWEPLRCPPLVAAFLAQEVRAERLRDIAPMVGAMRMIKSPEEIDVMRNAGAIAAAMVQGARDAMAVGVPEYEVALAVINAGTRAAAGFLTDRGWEAFVSPMIHNLQIMQSGHDTAMVHRRANVRRLAAGDPTYLCFCNMAQFKQYKLGFDRQFFIGHADDEMAKLYEVTVGAQQAALAAIGPGAIAEDVAAAANAVYADAGVSAGYRTGRSIGVSYLEAPELKIGDRTELQPGMTFAVDGGITVDGQFGTRIGDSIVVTDDGFEYLTEYPRHLAIV